MMTKKEIMAMWKKERIYLHSAIGGLFGLVAYCLTAA